MLQLELFCLLSIVRGHVFFKLKFFVCNGKEHLSSSTDCKQQSSTAIKKLELEVENASPNVRWAKSPIANR